MSQKPTVSIPAALIPEFEAWGEMTAQLFGELRRQAGLKPTNIPQDQSWFWTEKHQTKERMVDEQLKQGEYEEYGNADDLINNLHAHV